MTSSDAVSYRPGSWVAVSAPGTWLLVDLPPEHDVVQRAWATLSEEPMADEASDAVLDVLVTGGIRAAPPFALVRVRENLLRAVVRGSARVVVGTETGERTIAAAPGAAWADELVEGALATVALDGDPDRASAVELPMASGVTMAASIRVRPGAKEKPGVHPLSPPSPHPPAGDRPGPAAGEPQPPAANAEAPSGPETGAGPGAGAGTGADAVAEPSAQQDAADGPSYDFLFGATQRPPSLSPQADAAAEADAGVAEADADTVPEPAGDPNRSAPPGVGETARWDTTAPEPDLPGPVAPNVRIPAAEPGSGGLIDALPWAAPAAPDPPEGPRWSPPEPAPPPFAPVARPGPPSGQSPPGVADEVVQTVDRSSLAAAAGSAPSPPIVGPTVLAGHCPSGHLSPPHAAVCRVCGVAMPQQEAFEIPRPALGVLRLSTGDVVTLDRGVLIGRAPSEPSAADERPHLVKVSSPGNDVSRNHAEIVLDGWHVFVRDLGSTNGTVVELPGRSPIRLREGDLQLLEHRSVVTLADEVGFSFEVTG